MFEILYRLTEDIQYLKALDAEKYNIESDVEGFFSLNFNGNYYGYYHDNSLKKNEKGDELLTNWFISLLVAYLKLQLTNYVAINDIDSFNAWIELKKQGRMIIASLIEAEKQNGATEIKTKPFDNYVYGRWHNVEVQIEDFRTETIKKASQYFEEIVSINPKLSKSRRMVKLSFLISEVQQNS